MGGFRIDGEIHVLEQLKQDIIRQTSFDQACSAGHCCTAPLYPAGWAFSPAKSATGLILC
jgi:hypothetical protein